MEQELRFGLDLATFEAGFFMFSWANFFLNFFFYIVVSASKSCLNKNFKLKKKIGKYFFWIKNYFFRASCFGFRVKGVCPLLLPLVSL